MPHRELLQQIIHVQTQATTLVEHLGADSSLAEPFLQAVSRLSELALRPVQDDDDDTPAANPPEPLIPIAGVEPTDARKAADYFATMDTALWKQALMDTPIGIAILAGPEHQYIFTNTLHDQTTGRSGFAGHYVAEVFPELSEQGIIPILDQVYTTGKAVHISEVPIQLNRGDDPSVTEILVDVTYRPLRNSDGSIWGIFADVIDIKDRRALEQERVRVISLMQAAYHATDAERQRLQRLLHQSPAAIAMMAGPTHIFTFTNLAYDTLIGGRAVLSKPIREALPEIVQQPELLELLHDVYTSGEARYGQEIPVELARDGEEALTQVYVTLSVMPLLDDQEQITGIFVHAVDVTELVLAHQHAEEAVRMRDRFLSIAAHELKTPLTSLVGYTQMLQRRLPHLGDTDPRALRALSLILSQGQRLARLIDTVLEVTRITTGHLTLYRSRIDIAQLATQIVDEVQMMHERRVIRVSVPRQPCWIDGDSVRLEQVLVNLLQNAIKYSPNGGDVMLRVTCETHNAVIAVTDQGIGIPATAIDHIFERFYRGDHRDAGAIVGMGIGLSVVHEIVTLHGGSVAVESAEGTGSTFRIRLPLANNR